MTFGERKDLKKIIATNKRRAAAMERRVMDYLDGYRVPMSGAGSIKGDGLGYCELGPFIVECKYSAQLGKANVPRLFLDTRWLKKLELEVKYMRARFGVLVGHFHDIKHDYAFIRKDWYER